ncbi:MAG TPA: hypothetical protein VMT30_05230 [Candidatus Saccharimonadia bacterium]|nr:hypothetical protein [Candidatus Saccharimonadia bacterium]
MAAMMLGIFGDVGQADRALAQLRDYGYSPEQTRRVDGIAVGLRVRDEVVAIVRRILEGNGARDISLVDVAGEVPTVRLPVFGEWRHAAEDYADEIDDKV